MLLDEKDLDVVTIRAEMSRLRRVIGPKFIGSRPYRLLVPITSDVGDVFDALEAGDVEAALSHYAGPLLRQSVSPAIARLRTELSASLRGAVLADGLRGPAGTAAALARTAGGPRRPGRLAGAARQLRGRRRWPRPRPAVTWPGWTSNSADSHRFAHSAATVVQPCAT